MSSSEMSARPTFAHIDVQSFKKNIESMERRCGSARALVVVKADAYGHGMLQMAHSAGERSLGVASSDEAAGLIDGGISNDIWVLEGPFSEACLFLISAAPQVVWVIHSISQLELLATSPEPARVWLKLDTGMHRLGLSDYQLKHALELLAKHSHITLEGLATHFANADLRDHPSVAGQIECFNRLIKDNELEGLPVSLSNSCGVLNYSSIAQDWVRPGIALYGGLKTHLDVLKPVMSLYSEVIALRSVVEGEAVGYGSTWVARKDSIIATVAIGYGDGYPRHAENGTPVLVNGERAFLAGRVSMDMITLDVTHLMSVKVGDRVELWGAQLSVDEVAQSAGTIGYELLTQVSKRVPKLYF